MITSDLLRMYEGDLERCGFVLKTGDLVEVPNICTDPKQGFEMRGEDIIMYSAIAQASWHTHPGDSANLSTNDWESFRNYPELDHYIIGNDGVRKFAIDEQGDVINAS